MATSDKPSRRTWLKSAVMTVVGLVVGLGGGYYLGKSEEKRGIDVPDTEENMKLCICPDCPTYKGSPLTGGFYCGKGKTKDVIKTLGCICGKCPLKGKYGLRTGYFCFKGKSAEVPQ